MPRWGANHAPASWTTNPQSTSPAYPWPWLRLRCILKQSASSTFRTKDKKSQKDAYSTYVFYFERCSMSKKSYFPRQNLGLRIWIEGKSFLRIHYKITSNARGTNGMHDLHLVSWFETQINVHFVVSALISLSQHFGTPLGHNLPPSILVLEKEIYIFLRFRPGKSVPMVSQFSENFQNLGPFRRSKG